MREAASSESERGELALRDELAIDRTLLANERTLLSYLRSAVALLIAGVSIMHFSRESWFHAVGIACIPAGVLIGIIGVTRYMRVDRKTRLMRKHSGTARTNNLP